jgi:hypothetical protein
VFTIKVYYRKGGFVDAHLRDTSALIANLKSLSFSFLVSSVPFQISEGMIQNCESEKV